MIATSANTTLPLLSYRPGEDTAEGIRVFEIMPDAAERMKAPFKVARFTVAPNCASPLDSHAVHEIWMISQGTGELIYDDQKVRISAPDLMYFEPPKAHLVRNDGTEPLVVFSIWWSAPGE
jgi:mannose-6-phosphate isomerase-like protein (cupin superfamily)